MSSEPATVVLDDLAVSGGHGTYKSGTVSPSPPNPQRFTTISEPFPG
jgi:hypothetical protein